MWLMPLEPPHLPTKPQKRAILREFDETVESAEQTVGTKQNLMAETIEIGGRNLP